MEVKCPREHCFAPEMPCNDGYWDTNDCPVWKDSSVDLSQNTQKIEIQGQLPWTGNSLGIVDLEIIAARSKPKVVGIIGPYNAGKTTLLSVLYLLMSRGRTLEGRVFAGSYSFEGWENLARWMRWPPSGDGPRFPPHTSSKIEQRPGLLHLGFRRENGMLEDVLLTDAPGEWFQRWAIDEKDSGAEGARWIAHYTDAFALLIDSEALAGRDRGIARNKYFELAQRLASRINERPVAIVWSKTDVSVPEDLQVMMNEYLGKLFPNRKFFNITVKPPNGWNHEAHDSFLALISWLLNAPQEIISSYFSLEVLSPEDPLISFRGL